MMACRVKSMLRNMSDDKREVAEMILSDRDGYSPGFASACLDRAIVYGRSEAPEPEDISRHRAGRCGCLPEGDAR